MQSSSIETCKILGIKTHFKRREYKKVKKKGFVIAIAAILVVVAPYFIITLSDLKLAKTEVNGYLEDVEFNVYDEGLSKKTTLNAREYVKGALLCMSPEGSHMEALKAQAVVAFTGALREKLQNNGNGEIDGADFSVDSKNMIRYTTEDIARSIYGKKTEYVADQIEKAVDAVLGEVMVIEGNVVAAPFHQISSGKTESAENIWGTSFSHLIPVDSSFDKQSYKYEVKTAFTTEEINAAFLKSMNIEKLLEENAVLSVKETSDSKTVLKVLAGDRELTGNELRKALNLRSNTYKIDKEGDTYTITTYGLGHGVGLSVYGSDYLARQGKTYVDILTHYYSGISIVKLK